MISTPQTKGPWATSTPVQALEDSGYYGSNGKLAVQLNTLSPIKEVSNCPRTPDLYDLPKFRLSQEYDSGLNTSGVVRQLDFSSSGIHLKKLQQNDSCPSFEYHDFSDSDDGIQVYTQCTSNSPVKRAVNSELFHSLTAKPLSPVPKKCPVDIIKKLHQKNMFGVTNQILSKVSSADLCKMSTVSKTWRNVVLNDAEAKSRKSKFLSKERSQKENQTRIRGVGESSCKETSLNPNGVLFNQGKVGLGQEFKKPLKKLLRSKFDSFLKVGETCSKQTPLMKCPICKYAAKELFNNTYHCTECKYAFCRMCLNPFQNYHKCSPREIEIPSLIGSKSSKRNLKRL